MSSCGNQGINCDGTQQDLCVFSVRYEEGSSKCEGIVMYEPMRVMAVGPPSDALY